MNVRLPVPARQRWTALFVTTAMLALVAGLLYVVAVGPWRAEQARLDELGQRRDRVQRLLDSRKVIEADSAKVAAMLAQRAVFIEGQDTNAATSWLAASLESIVAANGGSEGRCKLDSRTPKAGEAVEGVARIAIEVKLTCSNDDLLAVLSKLETGAPRLFVDPLVLKTARDDLHAVEATFTVYGFALTPVEVADP